MRTYPGRLTRQEWLALSSIERMVLAWRADADLLELWRTCNEKPCRRAHACLGNKRCTARVYEADFKSPNFGQPDFEFSFRYPDHLYLPSGVIKHLQFGRDPLPAEEIVQECEAQGGAESAAALRRVLRLQRRRRRRVVAVAFPPPRSAGEGKAAKGYSLRESGTDRNIQVFQSDRGRLRSWH